MPPRKQVGSICGKLWQAKPFFYISRNGKQIIFWKTGFTTAWGFTHLPKTNHPIQLRGGCFFLELCCHFPAIRSFIPAIVVACVVATVHKDSPLWRAAWRIVIGKLQTWSRDMAMCQNCRPKRTAELVILNINHPILGHPIFTHTRFKTMKSMFSSFMYLWKVAGHEIVPNSYKFFYRSILEAKCTAGASSNCLSFLDMFPLRMSVF